MIFFSFNNRLHKQTYKDSLVIKLIPRLSYETRREPDIFGLLKESSKQYLNQWEKQIKYSESGFSQACTDQKETI